MSQKDFETIAEISMSLRKMLRDQSAADSILVSKAWRSACGEIIFSKVHLSEIKEDELILEAEEDRWILELSRVKRDLTARLNDCLGIQRFKRIVLKKRKES